MNEGAGQRKEKGKFIKKVRDPGPGSSQAPLCKALLPGRMVSGHRSLVACCPEVRGPLGHDRRARWGVTTGQQGAPVSLPASPQNPTQCQSEASPSAPRHQQGELKKCNDHKAPKGLTRGRHCGLWVAQSPSGNRVGRVGF